MIISLIVARSSNNVIGIKNSLPWNLPLDKIWFKKHTWNKPIIMGRCTWESLGAVPLKGRYNIVISKTIHKHNNKDVFFVPSISSALELSRKAKEIMVIGGESIYNQLLSVANFLYITSIDLEVAGDTYFPLYASDQWESIYKEYHSKNFLNNYSYNFEILQNKVNNLLLL
ncbi:MAG: type 3 dihydrofolate reductase [Candidatus Dasytiphilus stammeri]